MAAVRQVSQGAASDWAIHADDQAREQGGEVPQPTDSCSSKASQSASQRQHRQHTHVSTSLQDIPGCSYWAGSQQQASQSCHLEFDEAQGHFTRPQMGPRGSSPSNHSSETRTPARDGSSGQEGLRTAMVVRAM